MTVLGDLPHALAERATGRRRGGTRWLLLAAVVGAVFAAGYLAVAGVLAAVMGTASGADFSLTAVLVAALPAWLAAHQVPLSITGAPLDVLPMLPTVLVFVLVAGASSGFARRSQLRSPAQTGRVILVMGVAHAVAGAAIAVLLQPGPLVAVPIDAFVWCGSTATVAATVGMADRSGLITMVWSRVSEPVWIGIEVGFRVLLTVLALGLLVFVSALVVHAPEVYAGTSSLGDGFGMTVVSLLYLPNAVLAAWSFAAGPGVSIGQLDVSSFGLEPGAVPDLPLFAALGASTAQPWWLGFLAVPLLAGVLLGWWCRDAHAEPTRRFAAVAAAAVLVAAVVGLLSLIFGGRLGGAAFEPVSVRPGWLAPVTFAWLALPGALVAWVVGTRPDADPAEEYERAAEAAGIEPEDADLDPDREGEDGAAMPEDAEDLDPEQEQEDGAALESADDPDADADDGDELSDDADPEPQNMPDQDFDEDEIDEFDLPGEDVDASEDIRWPARETSARPPAPHDDPSR